MCNFTSILDTEIQQLKMIKKTGTVVDIDYSHGTILFKCAKTREIFTCTWEGFIDLEIGDKIKALGHTESAFYDASNHNTGSAIFVCLLIKY